MVNQDWSIIVFKCPSEKTKSILIDFYRYIEYLVGVNTVHFLIRDRVDDEVVISFRILIDLEEKTHIENIVTTKLQDSFPEKKFAFNPKPKHPLYSYATWDWRDRLSKDGLDKFTMFCNYLSQLSKIVVEMAENNYFDFKERVEMAHNVSWMLGCTEYGILSTKDLKVGYYDRIEDMYHSHLTYTFKE